MTRTWKAGDTCIVDGEGGDVFTVTDDMSEHSAMLVDSQGRVHGREALRKMHPIVRPGRVAFRDVKPGTVWRDVDSTACDGAEVGARWPAPVRDVTDFKHVDCSYSDAPFWRHDDPPYFDSSVEVEVLAEDLGAAACTWVMEMPDDHERAARAQVLASLPVVAVDQTFGVAYVRPEGNLLGEEYAEYVLATSWIREPYASMDPDQLFLTCARWLCEEGWTPEQGGDAALAAFARAEAKHVQGERRGASRQGGSMSGDKVIEIGTYRKEVPPPPWVPCWGLLFQTQFVEPGRGLGVATGVCTLQSGGKPMTDLTTRPVPNLESIRTFEAQVRRRNPNFTHVTVSCVTVVWCDVDPDAGVAT